MERKQTYRLKGTQWKDWRRDMKRRKMSVRFILATSQIHPMPRRSGVDMIYLSGLVFLMKPWRAGKAKKEARIELNGGSPTAKATAEFYRKKCHSCMIPPS